MRMNINNSKNPVIRILGACTMLLLACINSVSATSITLDEDEEYGDTRWGLIPYIFSTDSLGRAYGLGGFVSGIRQPQSNLTATAFTTDNDSWLLAASLGNFRFNGFDRWFFDIFALSAHYTDQRFYEGPGRNGGVPAGSNDSSEDDFITGISNDQHIEFTFNYPLAIGRARENPLTVYKTRNGLLISDPGGGTQWNPLSSGETKIGGRYFYRYRDLDEIEDEDLLSASTNGVMLWLDYDNTDFLPNASYGSRQKFTITRDFGWGDSSNAWTNLEFDASKYINLGTSKWFRQQVLALNFWTSSTPSWKLDKATGEVSHRPPPGFGSQLGGFDRMRAYPVSRFHDKSAVYYGAELRMIPQVNGLDKWPILKHLELDWWQVVAFAEAGRVAPKYNSDLFIKDLKWDVGLSFRVMAFRMPLRLDWAVSEEGHSVWAMYKQPFAR
ncbi:MAG: hypothetical protein IMF09_06905 [Proteobacteria bacterium]|nr:hypothetical protein [Pseudomonadota bacterium]